MKMTKAQFAKRINYTPDDQTCSAAQMDAYCQTAVARGYGIVCVGNGYVQWVKEKYGGQFLVSTGIDYPIGRSTTAARVFMASEATRLGADIIDLTMNASLYRTDPAACEADLNLIIQACKAENPEVIIKVIADFVHWNFEEKVAVCQMIKRVAPEGIKTHTGYFGGTFQLGDLILIRHILGPDIIVKAAGYIPDAGTAIAYLNAGLTEIGNAAVNCDAMYDTFDDYIPYFD